MTEYPQQPPRPEHDLAARAKRAGFTLFFPDEASWLLVMDPDVGFISCADELEVEAVIKDNERRRA